MQIKIVLTDTDRQYARHHGLTDRDMISFIEEMVVEKELEELFQHQLKVEHDQMMATPQCSVYDAW